METHCSHSNLGVAQTQINNDLQQVDQWIVDNRMIPNIKKTKTMVIGSRQALDNKILDVVTTFYYLCVRISNILSWEHHISRIYLPPFYSAFINKVCYPFWTVVQLFGMSAE